MEPQNDAPTPPKKNGWGGARANSGGPRKNAGGPRPNSGGKRPGAGRPRKPKPVEPPQFVCVDGVARNTPYGPKFRRDGFNSSGSLSQFERAWVYVAVRPADDMVKVGMSGNVPQRMQQLGAREYLALPVVPGVARKIETLALRKLGVRKGGSEWVEHCTPERAAEAVRHARYELGLVCHTDPDETPEEAFRRRVKAAA